MFLAAFLIVVFDWTRWQKYAGLFIFYAFLIGSLSGMIRSIGYSCPHRVSCDQCSEARWEAEMDAR